MKRELWDEYQRKSSALDMVWEMFRKDRAAEVAVVPVRQSRGSAVPTLFEVTNRVLGGDSIEAPRVGHASPRWGDFRNSIRAAVKKLPHRFTLRDVRHQLDKDDPVMSRQIKSTTLSSALVRMEQGGEIDVVTRGRGKAATVYLRKDTLLAAIARA